VTTLADDITPNDGTVSLREAITAINAGNGLGDPDITAQSPGQFGSNDAIHFKLPGAGPFQINVGSDASALGISLPAITKPVVIDGTTQTGYTGKPLVILNGASAGMDGTGVDIALGAGVFDKGVTVTGLVIDGFQNLGIAIEDGVGAGLGSLGSTITNNYIGTDLNGTTAVPNRAGIAIGSTRPGLSASNNLIAHNVISGNTADGVAVGASLAGFVVAGNLVQGNFIGTDASGTAALPNGRYGVNVFADGNTIGGPTAADGNVISGNNGPGIHVGSSTGGNNDNVVAHNFVGVDKSGKVALGNQGFGIEISGGRNNSIGANVVGGNLLGGIELDNGTQNNFVQGNFVGVGADGTTPVGNILQGIAVHASASPAPLNGPGTSNNLIGGTGPGNGNSIAFNGEAGIALFGNPVSLSGQASLGNTIEGNSIFRNGRMLTTSVGIDLSNQVAFPNEDGATANDAHGHGAANDPNNFQNFPVLTTVALTDTSIHIKGSLTEADKPNTTFRIEFFASNSDPLNSPTAGQFFLGFVNVTTDPNGQVTFDANLAAVVGVDQVLTATATDSAGNTSEFSTAVPVATANQQFVAKVYQDLFGRTPALVEISQWTALLDQGLSFQNLVLRIETDPLHEYYTDVVQGFYAFFLHRGEHVSDGTSPAGFVSLLAASVPIEDLRVIFTTSSNEYFQTRGGGTNAGFINALYLDAFGEANAINTDPQAQMDGNALFDGTATPLQVARNVFHRHSFYFHLVSDSYQRYLNRVGAANEIDNWAPQLQAGVMDQNITAGILGSLESHDHPGLPPAAAAATKLSLSNPTPTQSSLSGPIFQNTPLNAMDDLTDLYIFRSPADNSNVNFGNTDLVVTLSPFAGVLTPLSFDPRAEVDIHVVNVLGHLQEDFSFQFTFQSPVPAGGTFSQVVSEFMKQGNTTTLIAQYTYSGNQTIPPPAFPNNVTFPGDAIPTGKFIAGAFDDPFFMDAQGFTQFANDPTNTANPFPRPNPANPAQRTLNEAKNFFGPNANTLALGLEVPTVKLTTANPPLLGIWATIKVNGTQVGRVGRPLVDGLLIPPVPRNDLSRGERRTVFNFGQPATDVANFRADMIAVLTSPKFIYQQTPAQAATLVDSALGSTIVGANTGLLPDILTVDLSKMYTDAGNGFFNGRRLRDDVTDTLLQLVTATPSATDHVADDNGTRITDGLGGASLIFPYLGKPNAPPGPPNA
jgi:CSLREA domain-containing protein